MKLAIQSVKSAVDSRSNASSSCLDKERPSLSSISMWTSPREVKENPFGMSTLAGVQESTSADIVMLLDVKSPNLMYCETSIRKVVVQSCITKSSLSRREMHARSGTSYRLRWIVLSCPLAYHVMRIVRRLPTRSIPGINSCKIGTRCFAPG